MEPPHSVAQHTTLLSMVFLPMGMGLFLPPPHGWTKIPLFPPYIPPHRCVGRTQTLFTLRISHCYSSPYARVLTRPHVPSTCRIPHQ
jgi:hypothetical protein